MRKLFLPLALLLLAGCGEPRFFEAANYVIQVDSIGAPNEIASNQPLTLRFYGTVGPNACFSFRNFETHREPNLLQVVVVGRYESTGRCGPGEVLLGGEPLQVSPPFVHPLVVSVQQPAGAPLTREIAVR